MVRSHIAGFRAVSSVAARGLDWPVGEEREIVAGIYATLWAEAASWVLWRFEADDGVRFIAASAAADRRKLLAIEVAAKVSHAAPAIHVTINESSAHRGEPAAVRRDRRVVAASLICDEPSAIVLAIADDRQ